MSNFKKMLNTSNVVIGMVHLRPLPGSSNFDGDINEIYHQALRDVKALEDGGATAVLIENFYDQPFLKDVTLEQKVTMATICSSINSITEVPIGIDVSFNDFETSLAIANAIQAEFIRVPVFVDTVRSVSGLYEPSCSRVLNYRHSLSAQNVNILADIQVKETDMVDSSIPIEKSATLAEKSGADAIIVTGTETGGETPLNLLKRVRAVVEAPIVVGSGVNKDNISEQLQFANAAIVGSSVKRNSNSVGVDQQKVSELMNQLKQPN